MAPLPPSTDPIDALLSAHGLRRTSAARLVLGWLLANPDTSYTHAQLQAALGGGADSPVALDRVTLYRLIDRLTQVSYEALGLISYFTVGADEVRAWTVRRGASAAEAGGVIHSDIERGFIRAELMKYQDLIALGTEQAVSAAGKAYLKGKEYFVEDGDILNFRFSV